MNPSVARGADIEVHQLGKFGHRAAEAGVKPLPSFVDRCFDNHMIDMPALDEIARVANSGTSGEAV
jgi:hypothetical protein|tara:strand:+ start:250 stop:447 length:198 start_codon:yes stop_codon:yes gene_type:complete